MHMKLNYKTWIGMLLLAGTLSTGAPAAFSQVSIGIQIGAPPPPRVIAVRPPCPDMDRVIARTGVELAGAVRGAVIDGDGHAAGDVEVRFDGAMQ